MLKKYQTLLFPLLAAISGLVLGAIIMFIFGVSWEGIGEEPLLSNGTKLSDKQTIGICSDVNNIYNYLLQCLLSLDSRCAELDNDIRRAFIILYGHQEAMRLERIDEAEYFYNILKNNFSNCNSSVRTNNNCGCG